MSDHWNNVITFGCGVLLGAVITLTVIMVREIWRDSKGKDNNGDY